MHAFYELFGKGEEQAILEVAHKAPEEPQARVRWQRPKMLAWALLALVAIVALEWYSKLDFSLGVFYVFPVMIAAMVLTRVQVLLFAFFCACVRSVFVPELPPVEFLLRLIMAMLAYSGAGLLVSEVNRNRRVLSAALTTVKTEQQLRRNAEHQLRMLVDSSPAAILTINGNAEVLAANRAAYELLGYDKPGSLIGRSISDHVPLFAGALRASQGNRAMRTSATSWAKRSDESLFPVTMWFSTYSEAGEQYLAGILVDNSEEVRERERETFRHLYYNNRLFASAVSHEIRNLSLALRVAATNLSRNPEINDLPDYKALTTLIENLARISSYELRQKSSQQAASADLRAVLDQLRVVIEPDWSELDGVIKWELGRTEPEVHADAHLLLQVLLNLTQNSLRAVQEVSDRKLTIRVRHERQYVFLDVIDSGPGIADSSRLFQPFKDGSAGTGLGLYISRNLVRSCGGDLVFVPTAEGCQFEIKLPLLDAEEE